jgi:hypothetical protein
LSTLLGELIDQRTHPLHDDGYRTSCATQLNEAGALVLHGFFTDRFVEAVRADSTGREDEAYFASNTHNVWLTQANLALPDDHVFNHQIISTKGLLADDQIEQTSCLRSVYDSVEFPEFIAAVVGEAAIHPYTDDLSSINVHFHRDGEELGWHFDNSSFAVTTLITPPESGGVFEYVPDLRRLPDGEENFDGVRDVIENAPSVRELDFGPRDLVLFRGRNSIHRVTPSRGNRTRILIVFAFNTEEGIALSESAKETFYGRS